MLFKERPCPVQVNNAGGEMKVTIVGTGIKLIGTAILGLLNNSQLSKFIIDP